ncbi:MAG: M56 family metallopeptidase [Thermoguttaceae bacterium]
MQIFWEIVASNALIVTLLAMGVVLLSRFWRNPVGLHLLWVLILLKLCAPPIVTLHFPAPMARLSLSQEESISNESVTHPTQKEVSPQEVAPATVRDHNPHIAEDRPIVGSPAAGIDAVPAGTGRNGISWLIVLAWIWGAGIAGFAIGYTYRILRFRRLLGTARSPSDSILSMATEVASWLGLKRLPEIRMLALRISPLVWSLGGRPRVLLPAALFDRLGEAAQKAILTHELAHIRRKDHWVRWLELVMTTLFWWHPVVWWACRRLQSLEDECCDAMLVGMTPQSAKTYAVALLDTLDFLSERPVAVPLGATATRPLVSLSRRIAMLKNPPILFRLTFGRMALLAAAAALPMAIAFATEPREKRAGSDAAKSSSTAQQNSGQKSEDKPSKPEDVSIGVKDLTQAAPAAASNPIPPELQKPVVGKNWVILPLPEPTELQRNFRWNWVNAKLFVVINGKALLNDDNTVLDIAKLDMYGLFTALGKYTKPGVRGFTNFEIHGVPRPHKPAAAADFVLGDYLKVEAKFATGEISVFYAGGRDKDWNSVVADLIAAPTEEAMKQEAGIGDELIKVFPVCTPLSRFLVKSDYVKPNCMIRYMKSNDEYTPDEIKAIPDRAKKLIDQLNLKEPARVCIIESYAHSLNPKANEKANQVGRELRDAFKAHGVEMRMFTSFQVGDIGQP